MTELRASVRQVVEFSLHERDLSPAAFAAKRMREGAAAHKARQSAGAREETAYQAEKSLSADYAAREITLRVTGRVDGLLLAADGARIVEEIKLGTAENPLIPAHRAQAAMYGHMLCQKEGLTGVRLRILYVDENGAPVRLYEEEADGARLKGEFEALCAAYCAWAERLLARRRTRDARVSLRRVSRGSADVRRERVRRHPGEKAALRAGADGHRQDDGRAVSCHAVAGRGQMRPRADADGADDGAKERDGRAGRFAVARRKAAGG